MMFFLYCKMKVTFLLLIWLESFAYGVQINSEIRLVAAKPSSSVPHYPKIKFWKRWDETQPFFSRMKRSYDKLYVPLPVLQEKTSRHNKDSLSVSYNRYPMTNKQEVHFFEVGPTGVPTVEMRKRRSTIGGSFDSNNYFGRKDHDPYYVFGSVQSAISPRISRKAAKVHDLHDGNFTDDAGTNYRLFNYEVNPESATPILFLDDIAISPILQNENSKVWPNHVISKNNKPTRSMMPKKNINGAFQEKQFQYVFTRPTNDLATLGTINPEIHFPPLDNDPMMSMYSMNYADSKVIVPEVKSINFKPKKIANTSQQYLSGTSTAGLDDLLPVPFHLINWPYSLEGSSFYSTEKPNGGPEATRPLLKSLKIPQIIKLENQLSEASNSYQSIGMENLSKLVIPPTTFQSMSPTKTSQSSERFTTRGASENLSVASKNEPNLTSPPRNIFNSVFEDQLASNSNLNLSSSINFRKIPEFLRNSTEKKLPNAWIIVLQKRNENKLDFYHKILSLLNNINKKLEIVNSTFLPADDVHFTMQSEMAITNATKQLSKNVNSTKEISHYSAPLREFILNQIFLLSESLETLKEFEDNKVPTKILDTKFNLESKLLKQNFVKRDQKEKLSLASKDEAVNGWNDRHSRKKRNIANRTHFEAVDNILSFRLLDHALEKEDDEALLYLLEELLIETEGSLQSVARQYKVPILNLRPEIPSSVTNLDSAHISKLEDRKGLLKKIHLLDHLNFMKVFDKSMKNMMKPPHSKFHSPSQWVSRKRRSSGNDNITDVKEIMDEKPGKASVGPTFTLPLITLNESKSMTINTSDPSPLISSLDGTATKVTKLRRLNLAYGKLFNMQNSYSKGAKLEKRMLTIESDDPFPTDPFHGSINELPDLFSNSFVTQNRTRAQMEFNKRMLSVSNGTEILNRNATSPVNVFYEDANVLISEVPQHFLTDRNTTMQDIKSLLDGNGSFVSEIYIVKDDGCRTLKILHDKYLEENCNFNNIESVGLNITPFLSSDVKHKVINTGFNEAEQMMNPLNNEGMNIKTSEMQLMDFNNPEEITNSGLHDQFPEANNQFYDPYSPNSQALNEELLEIFSTMPETDLENSELLEQQLLNAGFSDDILNAYYYNPNSFADMNANSFASDTLLEKDKQNLVNNLTGPPTFSASRLTNTMMDNVEEGTSSIRLDASPLATADNNMDKENLLGLHTAPNGTELEMASSVVSQRTGRNVNDGVLPNDLVNILKLISNGDSSLNDKDKELAESLNAGIDILSNVESLLGRLGQGKVTVNTGTTLNPLSTRLAKTTATSAENGFLRNISVNPLFNGIRVDSEKQINIELTLDKNENVKKENEDEIEAVTSSPTTEPSVLEKLLNFRNTDVGKSSTSQGKKSSEDKLFVLPASFLKQLEGFDYSEFESIISYNLTKYNASKSNINKNSDKYFLQKLLENKDKLLYLLSNLNKDNKTAKDDNLDTKDISHLKNLIKDKADPVLDSIIATFFKPILRQKSKASESLTDKNITEISDVNFNSSISPGNLEIFILRYDGGGGGVQTLLKEYKDFTEELLGTKGRRKLAEQVGNNTDIKALNETTSQEGNQTGGIHDKVYVGTTTLTNGTNIKVTITINSNENRKRNSSSSVGGGGYHKEILLFGKDKPSRNKVRYEEEDYYSSVRRDPTDAYSSQNDLYNPILAANKPPNLRSNQNFGLIRLPRKTVVTKESVGKRKNSDFSLSLTNRKFSSRMQQLLSPEDYISQLMPPLPTRKLIPHYQFPIVLPLEPTSTKKAKWIWMKTTDVDSASSDSITKQTGFESSSINSAPKLVPQSEEVPTIALEAPTRNFFGENLNLDEREEISEMEESASNDVSWLW